MESRHCGQDKGIFFCPVHNASTPCSLQAFGIRCITCNHLTFEKKILRKTKFLSVKKSGKSGSIHLCEVFAICFSSLHSAN